jgi:hypothetical protein
MPCTKVAKALATMHPYVKIAAGGLIKDDKATTIDGRVVTVLADPGAKMDRDGDGPIIEVRSANADVKIFDLEVTGASGVTDANAISLTSNGGAPKLSLTRVKLMGNQGQGVSAQGGTVSIKQSTISGNAGGGISATNGTLSVAQSTISGNAGGGISATNGTLSVAQSTISGNAGGGISATNGTFEIVNNLFFGNGSLGSTVGGVSISTTQNAANRLEFNSFSKNQTQDGIGPAIQCVAGVFTARNNILSGNGTLTQTTQFGGTCQHGYSVATPGALPAGTGNFATDPMFLNATTGDLHVSATSAVRGAADPASVLGGVTAIDFDGQPRSSPADIGADEVP